MSYIGIDLGTTNSAICSFDGTELQLFKSPEQNDVTPSAIFIDRRGNRFVGTKAYNNAARNPDSAATLFKRLMGSSTPVPLPAAGLVLTPEECSAEIIRALCGYVAEEIWSGRSGTVVTVPAAFDQMQKTATMKAAELADVGSVALMQEPVAAVMSVVRNRQQDGRFVVFDIGGGTLDVAVAECLSGRVSLLGNHGISMCGGRDFDLRLYQQVVLPWLQEHFSLPSDLSSETRFRSLHGAALWACERAKIELSRRPEAVVSLSETETGVRDLSGNEVYLDLPIDRTTLDSLIEGKVTDAIQAVTDALARTGLTGADIDRIVFVGGPTHYKPLRDRVAQELRIAPSTDVNPMTAVAEGAAVFAESIDWSSQSRGRKASRGSTDAGAGFDLKFNFEARTPKSKARIIAKAGPVSPGTEFQIESLDTGWSSGRMALRDGATTELPLAKPGDNVFKIFVFDASGRPVAFAQDRLVVCRTAATIEAIPASHSIGIEARETLGGPCILDYLVRSGDSLPAKGRKKFLAAESLIAGSAHSLRFKLWEGEVSPISSNRLIGMFAIEGNDFDSGDIPAGTELVCDYEVLDSGQVTLSVDVPSKRLSFERKNFYTPQGGQVDYSKASQLISEQAAKTQTRIEKMAEVVEDSRLDEAQRKLDASMALQASDSPETARQAMENLQDAKRMIAETRQAHLRAIRRLDLDRVVNVFDRNFREHARASEVSSFDNLVRTAERTIPSMGPEFEGHLSALWSRLWSVAWRQDWVVVQRFNRLAASPHLFPDTAAHQQLCEEGAAAVAADEIDRLRRVVMRLNSISLQPSDSDDDEEFVAQANIVRR